MQPDFSPSACIGSITLLPILIPNLSRFEYLKPAAVHSGCTNISTDPVNLLTGFIIKNWTWETYLFVLKEIFTGVTCQRKPKITRALFSFWSWKNTGEGINCIATQETYLAVSFGLSWAKELQFTITKRIKKPIIFRINTYSSLN